MFKPIKTQHQHRVALKHIDSLMDAHAGSPEAAELQALALLVERYERQAFPIDPPSRLDSLRRFH